MESKSIRHRLIPGKAPIERGMKPSPFLKAFMENGEVMGGMLKTAKGGLNAKLLSTGEGRRLLVEGDKMEMGSIPMFRDENGSSYFLDVYDKSVTVSEGNNYTVMGVNVFVFPPVRLIEPEGRLMLERGGKRKDADEIFGEGWEAKRINITIDGGRKWERKKSVLIIKGKRSAIAVEGALGEIADKDFLFMNIDASKNFHFIREGVRYEGALIAEALRERIEKKYAQVYVKG